MSRDRNFPGGELVYPTIMVRRREPSLTPLLALLLPGLEEQTEAPLTDGPMTAASTESLEVRTSIGGVLLLILSPGRRCKDLIDV